MSRQPRIYSNGILVPFENFVNFITDDIVYADNMESAHYKGIELPRIKEFFLFGIAFDSPDFPYQEVLGVEKYVADDNIDGKQPSGMTKGDFPSFLYKTDEENNSKPS